MKLGRAESWGGSDGEDYTHWSSTFPEPPEAEGENKMTFFSHWVNPEVNCEQLEEPIALSKSKTEAKPKNAEPPKSLTPVRDHTEGADMK